MRGDFAEPQLAEARTRTTNNIGETRNICNSRVPGYQGSRLSDGLISLASGCCIFLSIREVIGQVSNFPLFHVFLEPWTVVGFEATHNQAQIFREFRFLTALGGIIVLGACKLIDYLLICPGILCKILLKNDLFEKRKLCT